VDRREYSDVDEVQTSETAISGTIVREVRIIHLRKETVNFHSNGENDKSKSRTMP
jgi:hypothetical protein